MDGFKRPSRPPTQPVAPLGPEKLVDNQGSPSISLQPAPQETQPGALPEVDLALDTSGEPVSPKRFAVSRRLLTVVAVCFSVILAALLAGFIWYQGQLAPVNSADKTIQRVEVKEGTAFTYIATRLKERGLIRNTVAFDILARLTGKRSAIQAGTCSLNPSESANEILDKLTSGCHDFKSITFFPGATIEKPLYKPAHAVIDDTMNVKSVLARAGFTDSQITAALGKHYDSPLFQDKPAGTSLEGYIYGETYYVATDASAESILQETFAQMYKEIQPHIAEYKKQDLNLYQAITLASIIQRELNCEGKPEDRRLRCQGYQETIAQIFLKRLREGTSLGSDVTFIYAADMMKVTPRVDIDSPYNTRIHTGLPPGPIAAPGPSALRALAHPSDTDYLFFIAGDDGLIYFAKTQAEHEQNIKNHCQQLCNEL